MQEKNSFQITLGGKSYKLCGEESGEYLARIASYIEGKYKEFSDNMSFRGQPVDFQHILLQVNIADDCFKAREELAILKRKYEEQTVEMEQLKASLVSSQVKIENLEANSKLIEKRLQDTKAKLIRLQNRQKTETGANRSSDR